MQFDSTELCNLIWLDKYKFRQPKLCLTQIHPPSSLIQYQNVQYLPKVVTHCFFYLEGFDLKNPWEF